MNAQSDQQPQCPYAEYKRLRQGPVIFDESIQSWKVSRYEDVLSVLRRPRLFSSQWVATPPLAVLPLYAEMKRHVDSDAVLADYVKQLEGGRQQTILAADSPVHDRLRQVINPFFTITAANRFKPQIAAMAEDFIAALPATGVLNIYRDYAADLAVGVVAALLSVSKDQQRHFSILAEKMKTDPLDVKNTADAVGVILGEQEVRSYFEAAITTSLPADDEIVGALSAAVACGTLRIDEAAGICREIVVAGNDTVRHVMTVAVIYLARHHNLFETLRDDRTKVAKFIEEVLRFNPPVHVFWRRAVEDVTIGNVRIPKGAAIQINYASANRDETIFADSETLNLSLEHKPNHLSFGGGQHFCLGVNVARVTLAVALNAVLDNLTDLRVTDSEGHPDPSATMHDCKIAYTRVR